MAKKARSGNLSAGGKSTFRTKAKIGSLTKGGGRVTLKGAGRKGSVLRPGKDVGITKIKTHGRKGKR